MPAQVAVKLPDLGDAFLLDSADERRGPGARTARSPVEYDRVVPLARLRDRLTAELHLVDEAPAPKPEDRFTSPIAAGERTPDDMPHRVIGNQLSDPAEMTLGHGRFE